MEIKLKEAIFLRENGEQQKAYEILVRLAEEYPADPVIHYQCAWSCDVLGEETKAIPYYEKAIALGLKGKDLEGAFVGLGSTYRTIGEYKNSLNTLEKGMAAFPKNSALKVFHAMSLYNSGYSTQAMDVLLKIVAETSSDLTIQEYEKAIYYYSDKLDIVWK